MGNFLSKFNVKVYYSTFETPFLCERSLSRIPDNDFEEIRKYIRGSKKCIMTDPYGFNMTALGGTAYEVNLREGKYYDFHDTESWKKIFFWDSYGVNNWSDKKVGEAVKEVYGVRSKSEVTIIDVMNENSVVSSEHSLINGSAISIMNISEL